jgi:hypothetical protein
MGFLDSYDIDAVLIAGRWSGDTTDDDVFNERLQPDFIKRLVDNYRSAETKYRLPGDVEEAVKDPAIVSLGLLSLTVAVAEWGVSPYDGLPDDPLQNARHPTRPPWGGTTRIGDGKHLASYTIGGIGISHLDDGPLERLFDYLNEKHPDLADNPAAFFRLRGRLYDDIRNAGGSIWHIFSTWMREALRKRDVQLFILEDWLERNWIPSYMQVIRAGGNAEEALVNARLWNSSRQKARCTLRAAQGARDRAMAEINASIPCAGYGRDRIFVLQRVVALFRHF